jgi:hypothetical protein
MHRTGNRTVVRALLIGLAVVNIGCDRLANGPSDVAPVSRLWYDKAPDAQSGFEAGRLATTNASFGARVFTSCDPQPVDNGRCPSLMVWAVPTAGSWCQLILYAPEGEPLSERGYPRADRFPAPGVAGLAFSCGRAPCDTLEGRFTIHRLVADADDVVTTLHATFEQTCLVNGQPLGRLTGEVWIVNGTRGSPPGFPGP